MNIELHLDEFDEWYDSTSHTLQGGVSRHEQGAKVGWIAAMRYSANRLKAAEEAAAKAQEWGKRMHAERDSALNRLREPEPSGDKHE